MCVPVCVSVCESSTELFSKMFPIFFLFLLLHFVLISLQTLTNCNDVTAVNSPVAAFDSDASLRQDRNKNELNAQGA